MGSQLLYLVADVFLDVLKSIKERGSHGCGPGLRLDSRSQVLLGRMHHPAIRVVDDHELLCIQQVVRDQQGTQAVVRDDPAGIADDVRVAGFQAQRANRKPRVHASQDSKSSRRAWG